jgi:ATP-independent RNA helicase DbpA
MYHTPPDLPTLLARLQIASLNEMQEATLKTFSEQKEIILLSNTGSGKTLAFLLPILSTLEPDKKGTQALIIAPSRELALQIEQVFKTLSTGYKITCCYGGHLRETEEFNLIEAPAVIVGTAGRLADHIRRKSITTSTIRFLVLDEFDKLMELGFHEEIQFIIESMPGLEYRMLISATSTENIPGFVGLSQPAVLNYIQPEPENKIDYKVLRTDDADKINDLFRLLCSIGDRSSIVFCNHRDAVERCSNLLSEKGLDNVWYHGAMDQKEREVALCKFRNGSSNVLVTTDLASRGLDITNIRYIIHYHLPATEDVFVHRSGRTARVDASGSVVLVLSPTENIPAFIQQDFGDMELPEQLTIPAKPAWVTLFFGGGKKNKINKVDIVGFLANKGNLKKEDIGLIEVKDFFSFAAVRRNKVTHVLHAIKDEKVKNQKIKIDIAR